MGAFLQHYQLCNRDLDQQPDEEEAFAGVEEEEG